MLLANAARLVDNMCTADAAALQQQDGAAASSRAWDGATAAERRCLMLFDVNAARYIAASNLGQQVTANTLAGNYPASSYSTLSGVAGSSAVVERLGAGCAAHSSAFLQALYPYNG